MKHYNVVAAIIVHEHKFLCVQRGVSKYEYVSLKYEFPGGKIEEGESLKNALVREIKEDEGTDFYYLGELTPKSFPEAKMKDDKGKSVPVVKIDYIMNHSIDDSMYDYITASAKGSS